MVLYCFIEIAIGVAAIPGKIIVELFDTQVPKVVENFRALCTGEHGPELCYQGTQFHRIVETFTIQGGDTSGTETGGSNIYKNEPDAFASEDLYWRNIDAEYLLCMAESTPRSQFFITLRSCPHLNGKHCCFGRVVRGQDILQQISHLDVDDDDRPTEPVRIARCGELEYKGPPVASESTKPLGTTRSDRSREVREGDRPRERQSRSPERQKSSRRDDSRDRDPASRSRRRQNPGSGKDLKPARDRNSPSERNLECRRSRSNSRDRRHESRQGKYSHEDRERVRKQELLRDFDRYKRTPEERPEVMYKGRGKMSYNKSFESANGRLG